MHPIGLMAQYCLSVHGQRIQQENISSSPDTLHCSMPEIELLCSE